MDIRERIEQILSRSAALDCIWGKIPSELADELIDNLEEAFYDPQWKR